MKGQRRGIGLVTIIATLALTFVLPFGAATIADVSTVKIDPSAQEVMAGDAFNVSVVVEDVTNLCANQATLNFDPGAMSASSVTEGDFLKSAGATLAVGPFIDNVIGTVTFSYALMTPTGVNGSGVLATIDFDTNPAAGGVYNLTLTNVLLANGTGDSLVVEKIANGTLSISGSKPTPSPTTNGKNSGGSGGGRVSSGITTEPTPKPTLTASPTVSVAATPSPTSTPTPVGSPEMATSTPSPTALTATPKSSGFSAVIAIVGLLAVQYLLRKKR